MKTYRKYLVAAAFLGLTLALPCRSAAAPGQQTFHLNQGEKYETHLDLDFDSLRRWL